MSVYDKASPIVMITVTLTLLAILPQPLSQWQNKQTQNVVEFLIP